MNMLQNTVVEALCLADIHEHGMLEIRLNFNECVGFFGLPRRHRIDSLEEGNILRPARKDAGVADQGVEHLVWPLFNQHHGM
jgi:hypothetical protein